MTQLSDRLGLHTISSVNPLVYGSTNLGMDSQLIGKQSSNLPFQKEEGVRVLLHQILILCPANPTSTGVLWEFYDEFNVS
ncbi:hypothetical protein Leryth_027541 [Lithospermum erythrorhizon]|nr:hypothetical protein Leryth_027541 [Lithospermum erythrorhizon]